jgi:ArsR family transcriptional regulator, lead/cadmium/zinc/bismuth-responsive transcriptional repressor
MDLTALPIVDYDEACDLDELAEIMAALASPSRLEIARLLADAELDVTELAQRLGASVATTSHHLGPLRRAGLVTSPRQGTRTLNRVANTHVIELCATACAVANPARIRTPR